MLEKGKTKPQNDTCLGVFKFDPVFSSLFGFCKMGGLGGEAPPKKMTEEE